MRATIACAALLALFAAGPAAAKGAPRGLHQALAKLARGGEFSGAVVVEGANGVIFSRGYGFADPFARRIFTPDTPADSGSLAKPVTAAAVLLLARDGKVDLDAPVQTYLPEYPFPETAVRHLLAHSAGLDGGAVGSIVDKTNAQLLAEFRKPGVTPLFRPGSAFTYCNFCYSTLAMLIERVSARHYLDFARARLALPGGVTIRPRSLADWRGRAIGYRRTAGGRLERADSYEGEAFYGTANLSISASQLARWGAQWRKPPLAGVVDAATTPALIDGKTSGLTWGNWYCATGGRRCHYLGHHEGFHHMLYWDRDRRLSVAMLSNNTLAPALQQRLQRAIVAFAEGRQAEAMRELASPMPTRALAAGTYNMPWGDAAIAIDGKRVTASRSGLRYPAYPIGSGIRYIPGLDVYISGDARGRLHWLSLYDDTTGIRTR